MGDIDYAALREQLSWGVDVLTEQDLNDLTAAIDRAERGEGLAIALERWRRTLDTGVHPDSTGGDDIYVLSIGELLSYLGNELDRALAEWRGQGEASHD